MPDPTTVESFDDQSDAIPDDVLLYRRIPPVGIDWTKRNMAGEPRLSGGGFQDYSAAKAADYGLPGPAMSVGLQSVLVQYGKEPGVMLDGFPDTYGLAGVRAGEVRALNQGVMANPTEKEPWHAVVYSKDGKRRSPSVQTKIAQVARWVLLPADPAIRESG